jgi:hypothetical protein
MHGGRPDERTINFDPLIPGNQIKKVFRGLPAPVSIEFAPVEVVPEERIEEESTLDTAWEKKRSEEAKERGRKGGKAQGRRWRQLREWTIELYIEQQPMKQWTSASSAAYDLMGKVLEFGRPINAVLSPGSAQKKIAGWISAYLRSCQTVTPSR